MIDVHCHLLYGVDDGARTFEESCRMLAEAKRQGIHAIILTPHYRHGMFPYDTEVVLRHYMKVRQYAADIGIRAYLGTEYHMDRRCAENLKRGRCLSLANSAYVLAEYSGSTGYSFIRDMTQEMFSVGYTSVIAHAERYACLTDDPDLVSELRNMGALIQVNADSVLGLDGRDAKRFCKHLLKHEMVDVVASDSHGIKRRPCHMEKCRAYIRRKYGESMATRLFETTPEAILKKPGE
ncbi:MAG: capsular biosynthesis protein [Clostridiales bacterium]|nr:capsular biosynthesis protein [Clostridiales bacterium]